MEWSNAKYHNKLFKNLLRLVDLISKREVEIFKNRSWTLISIDGSFDFISWLFFIFIYQALSKS